MPTRTCWRKKKKLIPTKHVGEKKQILIPTRTTTCWLKKITINTYKNNNMMIKTRQILIYLKEQHSR